MKLHKKLTIGLIGLFIILAYNKLHLFNNIILCVIIITASIAIYNWYRDRILLRSVSDTKRGTRSERKLIVKLLKMGFEPTSIFHDLYVEKHHGRYSQIDAVLLSEVGIIVFEVKDYSGWLFGKGFDKYWTQVLAYGRERYQFYNPVLQNAGHIETLKRRLTGLGDIPFYSVIIFYGKCEFRDISYIPDSISIGHAKDLRSIVKNIQNSRPSTYYDRSEVTQILKEAVANGNNPEIVKNHIQDVNGY